MPKIFDLNNPKTIQTIIAQIEKSEERDRKSHSWDAYQVFNGNQRHYVQNELIRTRPKSWQSYTISNVSLSRMVTEKISKAYKEQPIRNVSDDSTGVIGDRVEEIYTEGGAEFALPDMDRNFNLDRETLLWINYLYRVDDNGNMTEKGNYQFMPLKPYEYSLVRDKDSGEVQVVILSYPDISITSGSGGGDGINDLIAEDQADSGANSKNYVLWTNSQHVIVKIKRETIYLRGGGTEIKVSIDYVPIPNNPNNINPIGILPFVYASKDVSPDAPTKNPITEQSITYNTIKSEVLTASNIQGTGVMVFKYSESMQGQFEQMNTGITSAVELPQPDDVDKKATELDYKTPGANLSGMLAVSDSYLKEILSEHLGSVAQSVDSQNFSSGIERMIASMDIMDKVQANQAIYSKMEQQIFDIIRAWELFLGKTKIPDDKELIVAFQKPKVLISDREVLENIKMRMEMGLMTKAEALMVIDPNLSDTLAEEKLAEIAQDNKDKIKNGMKDVINANNKIGSFEDSQTESEESTGESTSKG